MGGIGGAGYGKGREGVVMAYPIYTYERRERSVVDAVELHISFTFPLAY